ncbi:23S rRNA (uracil(1939)-C(5))-methyltransferase RlmD [Parendozoicomonas haliclonae]|uniref:23S rRNA (uracil(1939)-C(5))-methyltransferase RlmD n=1 Tax=Parendozoicomonas haliclonae TaxID=1960125 RepID=A0A1X7AP51_9GAMM|nr:23S rRNA (uracil(1939)-C(5))-methyltransferase RlmD [Parendozoicomonas haliclonae]SMA50084.1 23S rRNA (uracil(1939)-C(5))-methyltransferase RlmD [Parendozoicomonas haliclonae]
MQIKRKNPPRTVRSSRAGAVPAEVTIESLAHDGRGIVKEHGRVMLVEGAVPGDKVKIRIVNQTTKRIDAAVSKVIEPSADRVAPPCPWFDQCGGCNMQHIRSEALLGIKQDIVLGQLQRLAGLAPESLEAPLVSEPFGYRSRARLAVRWWNGQVHFGFRAAGSKDIVSIGECLVLAPELSALIAPLREVLESSKNRKIISHIELAKADNGTAVLLRLVGTMPEVDRERWQVLAMERQLHLYMQTDSSAVSMTCIHAPDGSDSLRYELPEQGLTLAFQPIDFTQVNPEINQKMVSQALEWLALKPSEQVLDLFCGMGNFTLPLARQCREAVGVEGVMALVERGRMNAVANGMDNASFEQADLAAEPGRRVWMSRVYDAMLLDPPRTGALEILQQMVNALPSRILYVSCNPATLARDAGFLREQGYRLARFGIMDMFPQTTHVESMGLFVRGN